MFTILPERPDDGPRIETLLDLAFGADRRNRTVYRLRDGVAPIAALAFVALDEAGILQASIRYWPIEIGGKTPAILLGPLAVNPARRGEGMGKTLVRETLKRAANLGHRVCVLVGEPEYYMPFGFEPAAPYGLTLPGPVELRRFQVKALAPGALDGVSGPISHPTRQRRAAG
jgi:predicted N-acetyltransferase YhbS